MTLSAAKLKTGLKEMIPTDTESVAITRFVDAWSAYFAEAGVITASASSADSSGFAPGLSAMEAALVGMGEAGAAGTKIQAAVIAFWTAISILGPTIWVPTGPVPAVLPAPMTPPVALATISAALTAQWTLLSDDPESTLDGAAEAMADVLHAANAGGICTVLVALPAATAPGIIA